MHDLGCATDFVRSVHCVVAPVNVLFYVYKNKSFTRLLYPQHVFFYLEEDDTGDVVGDRMIV